MQDIGLVNANLLGVWLQLLAAGAYLVYLPKCVVILVRRRQRGVSMLVPAVCALIFVVTVINVVSSAARSYMAFSIPSSGEAPNPAAIYADSAATTSLLKNWMNVIVSLLSDMVFVYRTYIVWNMNIYIILLPLALLLGVIALGVWAAWSLAQTKIGEVPILAAVSLRVRYFYILTFCLNVICAGLICWKIWRVHSQTSKAFGGLAPKGSNIVEIIVQTAALYCAYLLVLIITQCLGSNVFFLFLDPVTPVGALVFTMLIVRARVGSEQSDTVAGPGGVSSIRFGGTASMMAARTHGTGIGSVNEPRCPAVARYAPETVDLELAVAVRTSEESRRMKDHDNF
ncbi:hypothetical protein C8Q70DRAFT_935345 [Cubamyces menziesii]|uniref:Uncharacterized protein n=1 Tax=Trametes cubensis TaxID=1111947 RepID=A0AAD7XER5_9APHY|nr:hypothetical protein C8Q70DRAFT_935345 [Cubamyces menziesii]KAJ8495735.1 hypothetical protein ONZ51_g1550 [Trametes cubensis]